eukprot:754612-Hanusia_phi.AAC.3
MSAGEFSEQDMARRGRSERGRGRGLTCWFWLCWCTLTSLEKLRAVLGIDVFISCALLSMRGHPLLTPESLATAPPSPVAPCEHPS